MVRKHKKYCWKDRAGHFASVNTYRLRTNAWNKTLMREATIEDIFEKLSSIQNVRNTQGPASERALGGEPGTTNPDAISMRFVD